MSIGAIVLLALGVYLLRYVGLQAGEALRNTPVVRFLATLPVAVIAALVAVDTLGVGDGGIDLPRTVGIGVAIVAVALRAPMILVLILGVGITALARLVI